MAARIGYECWGATSKATVKAMSAQNGTAAPRGGDAHVGERGRRRSRRRGFRAPPFRPYRHDHSRTAGT